MRNDEAAGGCALLGLGLIVAFNLAWLGALIYLVLKIAGHL